MREPTRDEIESDDEVQVLLDDIEDEYPLIQDDELEDSDGHLVNDPRYDDEDDPFGFEDEDDDDEDDDDEDDDVFDHLSNRRRMQWDDDDFN